MANIKNLNCKTFLCELDFRSLWFYCIFITKYFWSNCENFPQLWKVWSHYAPHLLSLEAGLRLHSEYARRLRLHAYMHAFPLALARVIEPDQLGAKLLLLQTLPTREDVRPLHLYNKYTWDTFWPVTIRSNQEHEHNMTEDTQVSVFAKKIFYVSWLIS